MFTGIIEEVGRLVSVSPAGRSLRLRVDGPFIASDLKIGDSIAVDGCCLTAETVDARGFTAFASPETMHKTSLGDRTPGDGLNLERALTLSTRLGGHLVSGHVDGTGNYRTSTPQDGSVEMRFELPKELLAGCIAKGSIAINGVSLTIVDLTDGEVSVWLIPETLKKTTLGSLRPGARVNIETDLIGKYVQRFMTNGTAPKTSNDEALGALLAGGGWGTR